MDALPPGAAPEEAPNAFARWLRVTMQTQGISQAELARAVGVADTQVSRWRRGQVVPTLRYLQQIADTFGVPRTTLDRLAGYPVAVLESAAAPPDPAALAEWQAHQARFARLLEERVPRPLWPAYMEACAALAETLRLSYTTALDCAPPRPADPGSKDAPNMGFRRQL